MKTSYIVIAASIVILGFAAERFGEFVSFAFQSACHSDEVVFHTSLPRLFGS